MTRAEVATMIKGFGLPFAYWAYPEKEAPPLPYVIYYYPEETAETADNKRHATVAVLNIELYTSNKDFEQEAVIEAALDDAEIPFQKAESYLDSEQMFEVLYQTEVVITGA